MFNKKQHKPKETPIAKGPFLSGTVVATEKGIFQIRGVKRYRVLPDVFDSWDFPGEVVRTREEFLANLRVAGNLGFREGSLIKDVYDSKLYLIVEGQRRHITSLSVFDNIGYKPSDALLVSHEEVVIHKEGEPIG